MNGDTGAAKAASHADDQSSTSTTNSSSSVYSDEYVEITVPFGWGIKQLRSKINPEITIAEFDKIPRDAHQAHMDEFFRTRAQIFEPGHSQPKLPYGRSIAAAFRSAGWTAVIAAGAVVVCVAVAVHAFKPQGLVLSTIVFLATACLMLYAVWRLARRLMTDRLWPGFLEERLKAHTDHIFCHAETDVRHVISKFVEVFLDNNSIRIRQKRRLQAIAIIGFYIGLAPLFIISEPPSQLGWICVIAWLVGCWVASLVVFWTQNHDLFLHVYRQALNNSAQEVSTVIMHRMTSLTALFRYYYNSVQQLQEKGEDLERGDINDLTDEQLKDGKGFFATRMLLWLAKRLESIEEDLLLGMQTSETVLAMLNIAGFIVSSFILWIGIAPAAILIFGTSWHVFQTGNILSPLLSAQILAATTLIVLAIIVSWYSYNYKAWNSGRDILRSCFETATVTGWNTCTKLKFDIALAGRSQRAMARISHLDKKTDRGG